ncbi:MAG: ParB N-terminal domain-containing protein, partial [Candidatus Peribacteraceae bacterium]|nr:ParB N-terminal domain-containing protein [Candidatus Peribacteraceae bacterium]
MPQPHQPPQKSHTKPTIIMVPVDKLKPAPYNPRQWNAEQLQTLSESISRFGFVDPIIINGAKNRKGVVIGGYM